MAITEMTQHGYTNHVDADVHIDGKLAYVIVNKNETVNGKTQRNVHVFEVELPAKIIKRLVRSYIEGIDFQGPAGYCTVACLPSGKLLVNLAATKNDGSGEVIWKTDIIDNVYKPYIVGQAALLNSLAYARTNPEQSDLRRLIREVIAAGK